MERVGRLLEWVWFAANLGALAIFTMVLRGANDLPWLLVAYVLLLVGLVGSAASLMARWRHWG